MKSLFLNKRFRLIAFSILTFILASILLFIVWIYSPVFTKGKPITFELAKNAGAKSVISQLQEQNVSINETCFLVLVRLTGNTNRLKAGPYELKAGESPSRLLEKMTKGIYALETVTVIEGWTFHQMRRVINKHPHLKHDTITLNDAALLKKLDIHAKHPEGLFYPDTYMFKKGTSDLIIYKMAHEQLIKRLQASWDNREGDLPYKKSYDALIMASIIEKETSLEEDRPRVASVFINRLKIGMKLQTDPTVIYGMGSAYQGKIRRADLRRDTAYNTYTRYGLPPTPIALPSNASIKAAFNPAKTDALYFVSRGDGSSQFSRNLDDHNKAVNVYILKKEIKE